MHLIILSLHLQKLPEAESPLSLMGYKGQGLQRHNGVASHRHWGNSPTLAQVESFFLSPSKADR